MIIGCLRISKESIFTETISFYDAYESFYHGFMVEILSNMDRYIVKSNYKEAPRQESEVGFHTKLDSSLSVQCRNCRSDILIRYPDRRGKAVIIELKVAKEISELEEKCDEALKQIEDKKYYSELVHDGYKDILKYGIAFYKKDCMIKKA